MTPDLLTLQRMACEVACGVLHLHRNNYIHRYPGGSNAGSGGVPSVPVLLPHHCSSCPTISWC